MGPLPIGEPGEELLDAPCGILRLFRVEGDRFLLHPHRGVDRSRLVVCRTASFEEVLEQGDFPQDKKVIVIGVEGSEVHLEGDKTGTITGIDHIVLAAGMRSYNPLEKELTGKVPVYVIGDAHKVGKAQDAIRSGYELARAL